LVALRLQVVKEGAPELDQGAPFLLCFFGGGLLASHPLGEPAALFVVVLSVVFLGGRPTPAASCEALAKSDLDDCGSETSWCAPETSAFAVEGTHHAGE